MATDKFTFFVSYYEATKMIPEDERGAFLMGILAYAFDGEDPDFDGLQKLAFTLIQPNIDSSVRSRGAGKNGGRPRKDGTAPKTDAKTTLKTPSKTPLKTKAETNRDRDMEKDRDVDMDTLEIDPSDRSISNVNASGDAAAAGAAPPAAKPRCPLCGSVVFHNRQTGKYDCPNCFDTFAKEAVVWT